ncbi:uncharacterized protein LOC104901295 [Beta vulgaris subsp. vulgaris]|uniref:uncharacterized protein LOC104901295 n=1 Tax=Beta vulgaris subsp. vulgaris TaxID=3555 RepID=UPI0005400D67|nr:uncharacterized protein LOC104901295 [Beta vulgaris subsp. vulgaris]
MVARDQVHAYGGWQSMLVNGSFSIHKAYLRMKTVSDRVQSMLVNGSFSIHKAYLRMKTVSDRVSWRRVIKDNIASPRSVFILWLAAQQRLATTYMLLKWPIQYNPVCKLCDDKNETIERLFFECQYTNTVWSQLLRVINIHGRGQGFNMELQAACRKAHNKTRRARVYVMIFTEAVYMLWHQRNQKIFCNTLMQPDRVYKEILFRVAARCNASCLTFCVCLLSLHY